MFGNRQASIFPSSLFYQLMSEWAIACLRVFVFVRESYLFKLDAGIFSLGHSTNSDKYLHDQYMYLFSFPRSLMIFYIYFLSP